MSTLPLKMEGCPRWSVVMPAGTRLLLPASIAGLPYNRGMVRVGPVYTPPEHRRRGYGAAVTAAASQHALDAGAVQVVLFTDLANPTSNSVYQRIGYRPGDDFVELDLA